MLPVLATFPMAFNCFRWTIPNRNYVVILLYLLLSADPAIEFLSSYAAPIMVYHELCNFVQASMSFAFLILILNILILNKASQNVPLVKFTCSRISASFLVGYMSSAYVSFHEVWTLFFEVNWTFSLLLRIWLIIAVHTCLGP
jgi:hypothetical protein